MKGRADDGQTETVVTEDGEASFTWTAASIAAHEAVDAAVGEWLEKGAHAADAAAAMQTIRRLWPGSMEAAHAHGMALEATGHEVEASRAYEEAYRLGPAKLPTNVRLRWNNERNRPYLRVAAAKAYDLEDRGDARAAAALAARMLDWDPEDPLKVRYRLGGMLIKKGSTRKAVRELTKADRHEAPPDVHYDLGLALFSEGAYDAAATALQVGLLENPYTGEMLVHGVESAIAMPMTDPAGGSRGLEGAHGYQARMGLAWENTPDALVFLRWVQTEPELAAARWASHECDAKVQCGDGGDDRGAWAKERKRRYERAAGMEMGTRMRRSREPADEGGAGPWPWQRLHDRQGSGRGQRGTVAAIEIDESTRTGQLGWDTGTTGRQREEREEEGPGGAATR